MRETLYRQMVYCINTYRTWIEVADDNLYKEHIISRTDRTDYLVSRTLVLRAFKTNGIHAEGMTWTIPEHELDKALAIYRKQDSTFKQRIKKAAMYFSPKDAETLIRLATYGVVQLGLIVRPTPMPEKPYKQSLYRLVKECIVVMADETRNYDDRNRASHEEAKCIMEYLKANGRHIPLR